MLKVIAENISSIFYHSTSNDDDSDDLSKRETETEARKGQGGRDMSSSTTRRTRRRSFDAASNAIAARLGQEEEEEEVEEAPKRRKRGPKSLGAMTTTAAAAAHDDDDDFLAPKSDRKSRSPASTPRPSATPQRRRRGRRSQLPKVVEEEEENEDKENKALAANRRSRRMDPEGTPTKRRKTKLANLSSEEDEMAERFGLKKVSVAVVRTPVKGEKKMDKEEEEVEEGTRRRRSSRRASVKGRRKIVMESSSDDDGMGDDKDEEYVPDGKEEEEEEDKEEAHDESSSQGGDEEVENEVSFKDEDEDDDVDAAGADEFLDDDDGAQPKVFTFYSKSELRRAKKRPDMTLSPPPPPPPPLKQKTPTKKSSAGRRRASSRRSTAFSPLAAKKKPAKTTPVKSSRNRRRSVAVVAAEAEAVKRETPRRRVGGKKHASEEPKKKKKKKIKTPKRRSSAAAAAAAAPFGSSFGSPIQEAQARLHVSAVPDALPCREDKFAEIYAFAETRVREGGGGCIYVSGVPGTGKTATVKEVVRRLQEEVMEGGLEDFTFVEINGMRLTEPAQAYSALWRALSGGQKVTAAHARDLLEERFNDPDAATRRRKGVAAGGTGAILLLVDELDKLWNRKQSVLYNLFDWPTLPGSRLVVVAVANTMDLPEKMLMNRVSSRLGLTRCQFPPYTHSQLSQIVRARLLGLPPGLFCPDAVQLVARKVASLSGDARRALDICRRATEIAQRDIDSGEGRSETDEDDDDDGSLVRMEHVTRAHDEMFCSPRVTAIRCCSAYERMLLRSIVHCFHRTGFEETTFDRLFRCLNEQLLVRKLEEVTTSEAYQMCMELAACRLILADSGRAGPRMRIWLNVSTEDVIFALDSVEKS